MSSVEARARERAAAERAERLEQLRVRREEEDKAAKQDRERKNLYEVFPGIPTAAIDLMHEAVPDVDLAAARLMAVEALKRERPRVPWEVVAKVASDGTRTDAECRGILATADDHKQRAWRHVSDCPAQRGVGNGASARLHALANQLELRGW